jgi:hypothetical protein
MKDDSATSRTGPPRQKRAHRKRRRRPIRKPSLLVSRPEGVEEALTSAIQKAYGEMFGVHAHRPKPFPLELKVSVHPGEPWRLQADPSVEEQIRTAVQEMATQAEAFRTGSAYCYRCDSPACPHSQPPRPTSVFGGYSSTGLPIWPEFSQILLERKHPHVDLLYDASQTDLVAMYMDAEILKHKQLNVFGRQSKTYDILGQVIFGFLKMRIPGSHRTEAERVAFTLQVVEFRRLDGTPRLELNVLARLSDGSPALDAIQGPYQTRVFAVIASARHRVSSLRPPSIKPSGRRPPDSMPGTPSLVADILQGLARKLEKLGRQRGRRTAHAEGQRVENRPTSKAWEDAFSAHEEWILWDRHERTFVVLGPRNRVHVFSAQGRHVTSLVLATEAVRNRMRRGRWLPLTEDQREQFGSAIGLMIRAASGHPRPEAPGQPASGQGQDRGRP